MHSRGGSGFSPFKRDNGAPAITRLSEIQTVFQLLQQQGLKLP
jgi:hypothetical protein